MGLTTNQIGNITEAMIISKLLKNGKQVLLPFGEGYRYDLVIEDDDEKFKKVQCKTGRIRNGVIIFNTCSLFFNTKERYKKSYINEIDLFAVYCPDNETVYLVPVKEVGKTKAALRIEPTKNNQKKFIRYAKDYELNK